MKSNRRLMRTGFALLALASFGGLVAIVLTGIERVHPGHGLSTYRIAWLVEFNWVGFLILLAVMVVALSIAVYLRILEWREKGQK